MQLVRILSDFIRLVSKSAWHRPVHQKTVFFTPIYENTDYDFDILFARVIEKNHEFYKIIINKSCRNVRLIFGILE